jgi:amino acid adenylation domain-containing protein
MSAGELVGMSAGELVAYLRGAGVELAANGDRLHCNAPKGVLTPELRAQLAERKQEVLALLRDGAGAAPSALRPVPRGGELPLSFAQQRMWFLDQLEPANPFYNIPEAVRITNALSVATLEQTLGEIVRRHEVLRATFPTADGGPRQVIAEPRGVRLLFVDLLRLPEAAREKEARALAVREARRPFDLSRGPLLRAALLRLGPEEHVLLLTMHHVVSDGWSTGVLVGEFMALYKAFAAGRPSPLHELTVQYADFAHWQRRWLQGEVLERQLAHWRKQLEGAASVLDLPTDYPRPAVESHRGASESITLSAELSRALRALSRRERVTLFVTLLSAFQCLLQRYSGQTDVSVGTPIAGRNHAETEGLIGFFVNTLVMRGDLSGDPSFRELLARTRDFVIGSYAHQDLPFEKLVEELQPRRELNRHPLFQVMFLLQNAPIQHQEATGIRIEPLDLGSVRSLFDMMMTVADGADGLTIQLEYSTDLFEQATAARLLSHFQGLLMAAASDPTLPLSLLPLSPPEELRLLTEPAPLDWPADWPSRTTACLHHLFEEQARRTPHAVALVRGTEHLTYAALDRRSSRLARRLRRLGVAPEQRVGVFLNRGMELVIALLGVLKAGGAYVPLDPAYPQERLRLMLEDSGARLVVTDASLAERVPESGARLLLVDDSSADGEGVQREPAAWGAPQPRNLAYVIYTSGSTGRPKGVAIEHASAATLAAWSRSAFPPSAFANVLASTSVCFDLSVFELFVTLSVGGAVLLVADALELASAAWASGRMTLLNTVPSALSALLGLEALPEGVEAVALAGEPLPGELVGRAYECGAGAVYNLYGPTEDTTYSTWALVGRGERLFPAIGQPVGGTSAYVVDGAGHPTAWGARGELLLSGAGLARGYLNRPALTAERFIPEAAGAGAGARAYRTGDVCRVRACGGLEYLGRADQQVKVRGYRIELGEVEAALRAQAGIREAAVKAWGEGAERRLAAYVVGREGEEAPAAAELKEHLRARVPEYMVPAAFVEMGGLPLTPNGKVDRKALAEPEWGGAGEAGKAVAGARPGGWRRPVEELVAGVWAEVLGAESVGAEENFFELGGHSLLATRVVSRLRAATGVEVELRRLFESPTIEGLAWWVEAGLREGAAGEVGRVTRRAEACEAAPLSYAQQRLWFLEQLGPGAAAYNVPSGVRLAGRLNAAALEQAVGEVVRRHEALRTRFTAAAGEPRQEVEQGARLAWTYADLLGQTEADGRAEVQRLGRAEARRGFDLSRAPLLRVTLVRLGDEEHVLLLTMHHIVSDGWSMGVLVSEVSALYEAYVAGRPSPLAELSLQYADYAAWQRGWLQGENLERQLSYWREKLEGAPPLLGLPTDRPRPPVQTYRGAVESFALAPEVSNELKAFGRRQGATLFMTLLTVFEVLLQRYTRQDDIVVGTNVAKRNMPEIENLIGFFVDNLVLRADLSGNPSFAQLLGRVRRVCLDAYAHQDIPFDKIVEELRPERNLSYNPVFQVLFVLQNNPVPRPNVPGLSVSRVEYEGNAVQFDMAVDVFDTERGLLFKLRYNTDLFDDATAARLMRHFRSLLESAAAEPGLPVAALKMGEEEEEQDLIAAFNDSFD